MQRPTTIPNHLSRDDRSAGSASSRTSHFWRLAICLIGVLLGFAIITRVLTNDGKVSTGQDYVHVVTVSSMQKERAVAYNYRDMSKAVPPPSSGQATASAIDDDSSEAAYMKSCLAALTRERNPEIMALTESERQEMCTDPRRH